jgi:hypothetical protein
MIFQGLITSRVSYEPALLYEVLSNYYATNNKSFNPFAPGLIELMFQNILSLPVNHKIYQTDYDTGKASIYAYSKYLTILYQGKI